MDHDQDDTYLIPSSNCSGHACRWLTNPDSGIQLDEDSLRLNETNFFPCPEADDPYPPIEESGSLFRFIVLGIGISVVAILGKPPFLAFPFKRDQHEEREEHQKDSYKPIIRITSSNSSFGFATFVMVSTLLVPTDS